MPQNSSSSLPAEGRADFFRTLFADQKARGLTRKQLAEEKGISISTIQYWVNRLRKLDRAEPSEAKPSFVEVRSKTSVVPRESIEFELVVSVKSAQVIETALSGFGICHLRGV